MTQDPHNQSDPGRGTARRRRRRACGLRLPAVLPMPPSASSRWLPRAIDLAQQQAAGVSRCTHCCWCPDPAEAIAEERERRISIWEHGLHVASYDDEWMPSEPLVSGIHNKALAVRPAPVLTELGRKLLGLDPW